MTSLPANRKFYITSLPIFQQSSLSSFPIFWYSSLASLLIFWYSFLTSLSILRQSSHKPSSHLLAVFSNLSPYLPAVRLGPLLDNAMFKRKVLFPLIIRKVFFTLHNSVLEISHVFSRHRIISFRPSRNPECHELQKTSLQAANSTGGVEIRLENWKFYWRNEHFTGGLRIQLTDLEFYWRIGSFTEWLEIWLEDWKFALRNKNLEKFGVRLKPLPALSNENIFSRL